MPLTRDVVLAIDDAAVLDALTLVLATMGARAHAARDLADLVAAAGRQGCGCIVLDQTGESVDPERLLQALREHGLAVPVIALVPGGDRRRLDRARRAGVARVLAYPIVDRSLLAAIAAACRDP